MESRQYKIGIVDDTESILESCCQQFEKNGFKVEKGICGEDAMKIAKAGVDVMIIDYSMPPGMDGIEAIREIRKFDAALPIIMHSGSPMLKEAKSVGVTAFIDKGVIRYDDLFTTAKELIEVGYSITLEKYMVEEPKWYWQKPNEKTENPKEDDKRTGRE